MRPPPGARGASGEALTWTGRRIDRAVETLDMLMAMQAAAEQPTPASLPPPPPVAPAIPIRALPGPRSPSPRD